MAKHTMKIFGANDTNDPFYKDGLENFVANLGTDQDKRHSSTFVNNKHLSASGNQVELSAMYRTDWLSGKVVDIIPNDMTREWRTFNADDLSDEDRETLEKAEENLGLVRQWNLAHKWARLYGTSFIILAIDDGKDPKEPFDISTMQEGDLKHIKVVDRHRVSRSDEVEQNPLKASFGMPLSYRLNQTSVEIHNTRVIRFDGVELPFDELRRANYWSDSVLDRLYESITNFNTGADSTASMIYETNVDIMKIKNLMGYLASDEQEKLLRKRFALASSLKSNNNMLLLDSDEDHGTKSNTFAGLPDLLDRFLQVLSAATDIPATRLLGSSANGLNATGEGDLKNYYDKIRADQNFEYRPKLNAFDIIMAKNVGIDDAKLLTYEFDSLFQMSPVQEAEIQSKKAIRDQIYLDQGVIMPSIVAKDLKQNNTYDNITDEHIASLEKEEIDGNLNNAFTNIGGEESQQAVETEETEEIEGGENPQAD
jgi:phage-related protein (TIGR01555 family)